MTTDLIFWRTKPDATATAAEIYQRLNDDADPLAELEDLPLDRIRAALRLRFPGFDVGADWQDLQLPEEEAAFEARIGSKFCRFDIGGNSDEIERDLRRLFSSFGCTCFEGSTGRAQLPGEVQRDPAVDVDAMNRSFERGRLPQARPPRKSTTGRSLEGEFDDLPERDSFYDVDRGPRSSPVTTDRPYAPAGVMRCSSSGA